MLDSETKRRIDTARDILVGKVPDPKSQVEQITIALIYKFMDDMDTESEELGGERSFFRGEFEKYAWRKIFDPRIGGFEILNLYSEAIVKMNVNPSIPQLFRDIFKNAYLPYRDPETLKAFLKVINEFSYDHSERLGDAFEYLLSVLGSQGDAGQFRTPRHIIDFMVAIIDPKREEVIMDPACGTSGFLISSYKHIIKNNSSNYNPETDIRTFESKGQSLSELIINSKNFKGDKLTPEERSRLANNIKGYDISPDMVRLSLVNMYLHGIHSPHIYEYDTLTSEDNWNEYADVILANPPFMTPKGGIRPHKRFSITSNRSEVLFVDYIAEHLKPDGRAAVIVPEGIIFQSGTTYKSLRKMLVETYLVGVISLPAGVFNPYSGVKTSILWFDRVLAKKKDKILFVKVENDGFDLGAQRRPITQNDLPDLFKSIEKFKLVENITGFEDKVFQIDKGKIGLNEDYNLSSERYRIAQEIKSDYALTPIGSVFFQVRNGINVNQIEEKGRYKVTRIETIADGTINLEKTKWTNDIVPDERILQKGDILLSHINSFQHLGKSALIETNVRNVVHGINLVLLRPNEAKINPVFAKYIFKSLPFINKAKSFAQRAVNQASIKISDLKGIQIPLPPLSVQDEIVKEVEGYQKIIDGAKQVVDNYKPSIDIDPEWPMTELNEVCIINPKKREVKGFPSSLEVSFVPMADINENQMDFYPKQIKTLSEVYSNYTFFGDNDVLLARVTPCFENGKAGIAYNLKNRIGFGSSEFTILRCKEEALPEWVYLWITTEKFRKEGKKRMTGTGGLQRVPNEFVASYRIALPEISIQKRLIDNMRLEIEIINSNRRLIEIYMQKIKDRIAKVWGT